MRKAIIFGAFSAVFLILMMPLGPAVGYQNQNVINSPVKETIDFPSFVKMTKQISINEYRALLKDFIQNQPNETFICGLLLGLFIGALIGATVIIRVNFPYLNLFFLTLAFITYIYALKIGCEWTILGPLSLKNIDNPCSSCALG